MNKIKILHIITLSSWGGAQRVCYDLSANLDKEKFEIEVACKPGGLLIDKLREKGIAVHSIESFRREISPIHDFKALIALYKLIKNKNYNIVHCHSSKAGILGRIAAKLSSTKKIYFTAHGWGFYNKKEYGWSGKLATLLEKIAARCSTKIITVSESAKKTALRKKISQENKIMVIKNGISPYTGNSETHQAIKEKLGISDGEIVFGMVSRLAYPKNPLLFLEAAKKIIKTHPRTKFVLIGGGALLDKCLTFSEENGLKKNVLFLKEKNPDEIEELLRTFNVFVLLSDFEGLPISILEAMFAYLPIVASDAGGIKELVSEGKNGFLLETDSTEELTQKMVYFIKNPNEMKKMGEIGRRIAEENFILSRMVRDYENLYLDLPSGPG